VNLSAHVSDPLKELAIEEFMIKYFEVCGWIDSCTDGLCFLQIYAKSEKDIAPVWLKDARLWHPAIDVTKLQVYTR
jgi:hypothetical protein